MAGARHSKDDMMMINDGRQMLRKLDETFVQLGAQEEEAPVEETPAEEVDPAKALVWYGDPVKAVRTDAGLKVAGYLIRFGGADLSGEHFEADTDFDVDMPGKASTYFHHGLDPKVGKRKLGRAEMRQDDFGIWAETILQERDEYEKFIADLAVAGKLGWSSGTVGHLMEREGSKITRWPIAEASLTHTPAEPRNSAVPMKSLSIPAPEAVFVTAVAVPDPIQSENEVIPMEESAIKSLVDTRVDEAIARIEGKFAELLVARQAPAGKSVTDLGFSKDETKSFLHFVRTGDEVAYKAAMQGQVDPEGGYAVPTDFLEQIVAKRNEGSIIRRMGVAAIPTSRDRVLVPIEGTSATKFVVTAEEAPYDQNEPTLGQVAITIHKLTKLMLLSEELDADTVSGFGPWLAGAWGRSQAAAENNYLIANGTGTSMPQSMAAGATDSGITAASATAVTAAELLSLLYAMPDQYADNMALVMKRATLGMIRSISGNPFVFMPTPAGEGSAMNPGTIQGVPVFVTSEMPAATTGKRAIMVVNPDFYGFAEREGMSVTRNPWLYQRTGQIGLFAKFRQGGAVLQSEAMYYMKMG